MLYLYHRFKRLLRWLLVPGVVWLLAWYAVPWCLELPAALTVPVEPGTRYLAADGSPLRHFLNADGLRVAEPVPFDKLPQALVDATVAAEDKRFFSHGGVDELAILRALWQGAQAGRVTSGASTITQQLIKISSPKQPRTLLVKLREALLARRLEMTWSKQAIFAAYANRVGYGNLFTGCPAAAEGYFRKPLSNLSVAECAFLAAMPQAPSRLNPFRDPGPVQQRQQWVLGRMKELRLLDHEHYEVAAGERLRLQRFHGGFAAPHAVELLQDQPTAKEEPVVRTTLDSGLQRRVETIIATRLETLRPKHVEHAAVVVIENDTGRVIALAGSRDFFSADGGQINGAWVPHSPGSALKPFTYALAFTRGATPASIVADLPQDYPTRTGLYQPENYNHQCYGPMTYRYALGNSLNISAVKVLASVGGPATLVELLQKLGIRTLDQPPEHYGLGLTIGNAPVRLIELANAYATLARLGEHRDWTLRADAPPNNALQVMDKKVCWWLADILSDNQARVLTFGLHSPLRLPFRVAVKTGTSTSYRDNWTVGFTPQFTVGVWAGNFEGQPMEDVTGVTGAGPIFRDVFTALNEKQKQRWYAEPAGLVRARIDPRTGHRVPPNGPPVRMSREEVFFGDALPPLATSADYEQGTGKAILPVAYRSWLASSDNWLDGLVTCASTPSRTGLHIVSPVNGLVVRLDPDLPDGRRLLLRAEAAGQVSWQCATLTIQRQGSSTFALLVKGEHVLNASADGQQRSVRIKVE